MKYRSIIGYEEDGKYHISFGRDEGGSRLYGEILLNSYKDIDKIKKLVSGGDHRTVSSNLDYVYYLDKQKELILNSIEDVFKYYKRRHIWYLYMFKDNKWFVWKDFTFNEYGNEIDSPECEHKFVPLEELYQKYAIKDIENIVKVKFESLKLVVENFNKLDSEDKDRFQNLVNKVNEINKILKEVNEKDIL